MRIYFSITYCLCVLMLLSACSSDMLPFSSDALEGTVTVPPDNWTQVASQEIIQLETNPADPYSVNLWIIGEDENLFVFAGGNRATWIEHIEKDANVRLKIGNNIYELKAARETDPEVMQWFAGKWDEKYGRRPRNENVEEAYLIKLTKR